MVIPLYDKGICESISYALADSSIVALKYAQEILPQEVSLYQVDLMNLQMENCWDTVFLLDVLEHLPEDKQALEEIKTSLRPGGLLFVTAPAFPQFWSYIDDFAHHARRYRRKDFERLANRVGLRLVDVRYFMFFLSPLYILSRLEFLKKSSIEEIEDKINRLHKTPNEMLNNLLAAIFEFETPFGHHLRFPWGTSILGIFKKT